MSVPKRSRKTIRRARPAPDSLTTAIGRELGVGAREQLAFELEPPRRRGFIRSEPPCSECGRRGYHLARCSRST